MSNFLKAACVIGGFFWYTDNKMHAASERYLRNRISNLESENSKLKNQLWQEKMKNGSINIHTPEMRLHQPSGYN